MLGIFYNRENRDYNPNPYNSEVNFSAFPSSIVSAMNLSTNDYEALRSSDIFTAVTTLSKDIARMDIKIKEDGVLKEKATLSNLLNNRPNKIYNAYQLKFSVMLASLLTGVGYILIERANGTPVELYHIPTSRMQLKQDKQNGNYYYEINNGGKTEKIDFDDVIAIKPFTDDGLNTLNILNSLKDDLDTQNYSKRFFANFFKNNTKNGSLLKMKQGKLSPEARNKIRDEWQKANSGENNSGKVLVLDETMEFEQLEIDTEILKLINTNKSTPTAIAKAFSLPAYKLGLESPNTSMQDQADEYLFNTLNSYMKVWTAELNFKLISSRDDYKKELVFDTTSFRQINHKEFVETLNSQLDKGAITLDEYRAGLGMPPLPNGLGTTHRVSLNNIDIALADDFQLRETSTNNQATKSVSNEASEGGDISEQEGN